MTNINLDLQRKDHRQFLAEFIEYMTPRLEGLRKVEEKAASHREMYKNVGTYPLTTIACIFGSISFIVLISVFKLPWLALMCFVALVGLGLQKDVKHQAELVENAMKLRKKASDESQKMLSDAKQEYQEWIRAFTYKKLSNDSARMPPSLRPPPPPPPGRP